MRARGITTHHDRTNGDIYLRTQHGMSSAEIIDALRHYVGRDMHADLRNNYGHRRRYAVRLLAVDGEQAQVRTSNPQHTVWVDAFDAFGTHCTIIEPEKVKA